MLDLRKAILVVDGEPAVVRTLCAYLERAGYAASAAADRTHAASIINDSPPDLVVLDPTPPGIDGWELMRQIKHRQRIAVVLLSANANPDERTAGLRLGADDYLCKPFAPAELLARIEAVLRRTARAPREQRIVVDELEIDPAARLVTVEGTGVRLTPTEFDLLHYLARHPGQVFSQRHLLQRVWRYDVFTESSTVPVHIRRLRCKVEPDPASPQWVKTVRGAGYRFDP
jgi:two-component system phosphate regulon response regulator PhoB